MTLIMAMNLLCKRQLTFEKNFNFLFIIIHSLLKNSHGAIGILTTLVLSVVMVTIAISLTLNGISARANVFYLSQSEQVFVPLDGCIEEALIQLARDSAYALDSYVVNGVSCMVNVSGVDPNRDIVVTGSKNNITRDVLIRVQLAPFGITEWSD